MCPVQNRSTVQNDFQYQGLSLSLNLLASGILYKKETNVTWRRWFRASSLTVYVLGLTKWHYHISCAGREVYTHPAIHQDMVI